MSPLYNTVSQLCTERGLSIAALCRRAGVSPGILTDLKKGRKQTINVQTAVKLAAALGVSADCFGGTAGGDGDAFLAFYGSVKDDLNEKDKNDLIAFMRIKAELNKRETRRKVEK